MSISNSCLVSAVLRATRAYLLGSGRRLPGKRMDPKSAVRSLVSAALRMWSTCFEGALVCCSFASRAFRRISNHARVGIGSCREGGSSFVEIATSSCAKTTLCLESGRCLSPDPVERLSLSKTGPLERPSENNQRCS